MGGRLGLGTASREGLVARIGRPRRVSATSQRRIVALARRLGSSGGTGVPGTKPAQRPKASGRPRARRDRGGKQRLGARLVSLIVTLRAAVRVPGRRLRWRLGLGQLCDLHRSAGASTAARSLAAVLAPPGWRRSGTVSGGAPGSMPTRPAGARAA